MFNGTYARIKIFCDTLPPTALVGYIHQILHSSYSVFPSTKRWVRGPYAPKILALPLGLLLLFFFLPIFGADERINQPFFWNMSSSNLLNFQMCNQSQNPLQQLPLFHSTNSSKNNVYDEKQTNPCCRTTKNIPPPTIIVMSLDAMQCCFDDKTFSCVLSQSVL